MSFAATLTPAIFQTALTRLALLFLPAADGDMTAAQEAAAQSLDAYQVESVNELRLAAQIISFGMHALEALSQAAAPDLPLNLVLRLRSGAVSLSRECHRAEQRLDQLQRARREGAAPQAAETEVPERARAQVDKAIALIEATRQTTAPAPKAAPVSLTDSHRREAARRITENLKRNQAGHLAAMNLTAVPAQA